MSGLTNPISSIAELEEKLATSSPALVEDMSRLEGDILVLGAGGKMGPSLVKLACNAVAGAGVRKRVTAVSRFSQGGVREELEAAGATTIASDLLEPGALETLPDSENVIYMAATKFGTAGREHFTWAQNAFLPGLVGKRYRDSRIVAFSTGNVYPLVPVRTGGSRETDPVAPIGEYAQSCLGRERLFEHASHNYGTPIVLFRLNYAVELRYGALVDIALAIRSGQPIDISMGHLNVIWQGDANEMALRSLSLCNSPPAVLNVTGPEVVTVTRVARQLGERLGTEPILVGEEQDTALLSDAGKAFGLFGYPTVPLEQLIDWVAHWVESDGSTHGKPTHFGERSGKF
ncbi:MAG: NAD-dependent epimerase/dehydratase family protein [Trueperaceae bacterium]